MNNDDKKEVCDRIIKHIVEEGNGYCRVGWATHEVKLAKGRDNFAKDAHKYAYWKSVETLVTQDGQYMSEPCKNDPNDFDIKKDPSYKKPKWHEENYWKDKLIWAAVTAIFSIIAGYLLWLATTRSLRQENIQRDLRVGNLSDSIRTIQTELKVLRDSASKSVKPVLDSTTTKQ